ncbi:MAG: serine protease [Sporichthyaceae bacterium]
MNPRTSPFRRTVLSATLTVAAATAAVIVPNSSAIAADPPIPEFATAPLSTIHPGISTVTKGAACTSNFVFLDSVGHAYLGQAAHCSGTGESTDTDGCQTASHPLGTPVDLGASGVKGKVAYSSWIAMQKVGETDTATCAFNDFALIRIPNKALNMVNPSIPLLGGPTGLRTGAVESGETVVSYGNSPLRGGIELLSPKQGVSLGTDESGWTHNVYTATPGVPGDSGSGYLDADGNAFGVLSTLALAPLPASNGVTDLAKALAYAQEHSGIAGLRLANGTEGFSPGVLPVLAALTGGVPIG